MFFIGARQFDDLVGDIFLPSPQHDIESHAGQDGVVVFANGKRGREFTLESHFHVNTWALACSLMADYYAEPTLTPYNIIRGTENYAATNFRFVVLGVEVAIVPQIYWSGIRTISTVLTRVQVSPAFRVVGKWRLVAIDTSLELTDPLAPPPPPPPEP